MATKNDPETTDAKSLRPRASEFAKSRGTLLEALELACACIELGASFSITEKLIELNVSKDYYYRRALEFKEITGLDLTDEIDAQIDADDNGIVNPRSDLFTEYRMIRKFFDTVPQAPLSSDTSSVNKVHRRRIRLGASEILINPLVRQAVRAFHSREEHAENRLEVVIDIGVSGELHRRFADYKVLDMYVSQIPDKKDVPGKPVAVDHLMDESSDLCFWVVCPHDHPAVQWAHSHVGEPIPAETFRDTTLVLVGHHPRRSPQYHFPKEMIRKLTDHLRVIEADTFAKVHNLVVSGPTNIAALTIPEFIDEERLRLLTPLPLSSITGFPKIDPLRLGVFYRKSEVTSDRAPATSKLSLTIKADLLDRDKAIEQLAGDLRDAMNRMVNSEVTNFARGWLGNFQHIYYERTSEITDDAKCPRGWVHSTIRWQLLSNGCLVGRHLAEKPRGTQGEFNGTIRPFDILGRLLRNPDNNEYHLLWTAINHRQEVYAASFVIPEQMVNVLATDRKTVNLARNIVGVWIGRRTSQHSLQPSAGRIVIALQPESWHLGTQDLPVSKSVRDRVLSGMIQSVTSHESLFPGLLDGQISDRWEWERTVSEVVENPTQAAIALMESELTKLKLWANKAQTHSPELPTVEVNPEYRGNSTGSVNKKRKGSK